MLKFLQKSFRFLPKEIIEKIKIFKKSFSAQAARAKQVWGYEGGAPLFKKMFGKSEEKDFSLLLFSTEIMRIEKSFFYQIWDI